jgi:hypothetical protein
MPIDAKVTTPPGRDHGSDHSVDERFVELDLMGMET